MKIVFFGTPNISRIFLEHILRKEEVVGVVTSPDRPAGRGLSLQASPVKEFALKNNLKVFTPKNLKDDGFIAHLSTLGSQLFVVVSYGKIIPEDVFKIPEHGCINVHFSLLPKYRGAAPIQRAIINGEKKTGVTVFFIESGLDTGDIILQREIGISSDDDAITLEEKLLTLGKELLDDAFDAIFFDNLKIKKQSGIESYAPILRKEDGRINWDKSSLEIHNLIRGIINWPVAYAIAPAGNVVKIFKSESLDVSDKHAVAVAGQVVEIVKNEGFLVKCKKGYLKILEVRPENKKRMSAWEYMQGARLKAGDKFK